MSKYKVWISIPQAIDVEAESEEDAKEKVLTHLVNTKQIKPADYIELEIIQIN